MKNNSIIQLNTIVATRLQEAVTELYLAESDRKRASLWKKVKTQLDKTPADPALVQQIVEAGATERLAKLVGDLVAGRVVVRD